MLSGSFHAYDTASDDHPVFFVKGIQSTGIVADVKHYAANNQETGRSGIDTHVSRRALYEIYFPGFKACVDAGCMTVMSAYNKVNGYACALNKWLLTDVLKDEWGFEGVVDSDWGAVYDQVDALNAGNDLEQPKVRDHSYVLEALKDGRLTEEQLDKAVERVLRLVLESGPITQQALTARLNVQPGSASEVIRRLEGVRCGRKATSCPDQLAQALKLTLEQA